MVLLWNFVQVCRVHLQWIISKRGPRRTPQARRWAPQASNDSLRSKTSNDLETFHKNNKPPHRSGDFPRVLCLNGGSVDLGPRVQGNGNGCLSPRLTTALPGWFTCVCSLHLPCPSPH